jgi:hypothetical protein
LTQGGRCNAQIPDGQGNFTDWMRASANRESGGGGFNTDRGQAWDDP